MYSKILVTLISFLIVGCSTSQTKKLLEKTSEDIKNTTQKTIDTYKGNQPKVVMDDEDTTPPNEQVRRLIDLHNEAREEVGIQSKIKWSPKIAKDAKTYADILANSGEFEHDSKKNHLSYENGGYENGPYGENLYAYYNSNGKKATFEMASNDWINEKNFYHYGKVSFDGDDCDRGEQCGHYTQIIWENTTRVGCAISQYKKGKYKGGYVVVCKYKTPGNIIGQYPY